MNCQKHEGKKCLIILKIESFKDFPSFSKNKHATGQQFPQMAHTSGVTVSNSRYKRNLWDYREKIASNVYMLAQNKRT